MTANLILLFYMLILCLRFSGLISNNTLKIDVVLLRFCFISRLTMHTNSILSTALQKNYPLLYESTDLERIASKLLQCINWSDIHILGIDGPTGAGKSTMTMVLQKLLLESGRAVDVISLDWFLTPPMLRKNIITLLEENRLGIHQYSATLWKIKEITDALNAIRQASMDQESSVVVLEGLFNREKATYDVTKAVKVQQNGVILVDGVGAMSDDFRQYMDIGIWIDVLSDDLLLERKMGRELLKEPSRRIDPEYMRQRFWRAEHLHSNFLRATSLEKCRFVVDNTSVIHKLYQKNDR